MRGAVLTLIVALATSACVAPEVANVIYHDGVSYAPLEGGDEPTCETDLRQVDVAWPAPDGPIGRLSEPSYPESTMTWTSEVLADAPGPAVYLTTRSKPRSEVVLVVESGPCLYPFVPS